MSVQPDLFSAAPAPAVRVTAAVTPAERKRLSRQIHRLIARLREGDAANYELTRIAMNLTARVSEARQAGFDIRVVRRNARTGVCWYRLESEP